MKPEKKNYGEKFYVNKSDTEKSKGSNTKAITGTAMVYRYKDYL